VLIINLRRSSSMPLRFIEGRWAVASCLSGTTIPSSSFPWISSHRERLPDTVKASIAAVYAPLAIHIASRGAHATGRPL